VVEALGSTRIAKPIYSLAVTKMPHSGKPEELLDYEGISAKGIMKLIKSIKF
jgi:transketolase